MLKEHERVIEGISRTADLCLVSVSFVTSAFVSKRYAALAWLPRQSTTHVTISADQYALLFTLSILSWLVAAQLRGLYLSVRAERSAAIIWDHLVTGALWVLLVLGSAFFLKLEMISRSFLIAFLPMAVVTLCARQGVVQLAVRYLRTRGFNLRDVVIVGDRSRVARFAQLINQEAASGYCIVEQVITVPGSPAHCCNTEFDEVFVLMGSGLTNVEDLVMRFVKQGKRVHFIPGVFDVRQFRQSLTEFAGIPALTLGGYGLSLPQSVAKRVLDLVGSMVLLIVLAPLFALLALLVKLSSPGPILFSQERLGEGGRRFRIYKFRTMCQDAENILRSDPILYERYVQNNYKLPKEEDSRITPIGRILRSTSLDELPQLFNVLRGEMSLVGPRPVVPSEVEMYGDCSSLFMSVKPGMTGNWQIKGRSDIEDYGRRAALDLEYIRDQSFKNDVDILLKTLPAVALRRGAH